jgi:hypothetical protein
MGDVGDYWREHKDYKRRRESADNLGMSMREYDKWDRQQERERKAGKKADHLARCTIKCECGKWLLDTAAHNCHKRHLGKKGHSVIETKEVKKREEIDWSDII